MKIYEFFKGDYSRIKSDIDSFLFFDEKWMFIENKDYISLVIDYMDVDIFIKVGIYISNNLNKDNISIKDYDISHLNKYF